MNTEQFKIYGPLLILLGALALTVLLIMSRPEARQAEPKQVQPLVDVVEVQRQTVSIPVEAQGNVKASQQTLLIADVAGRVEWLADEFRAGGFFRKGAKLARIDQRDYVAAVKRAEAGVASAESALAQERGRADVARKEWETRGKNIARSDAATALYLRKPQLAEAQSRLESARADLVQAKADLEHTIVRAPYDAMVRDKAIDLGQSLSRGNHIATLFSVATAEVEVPLPQRDLPFIALPNAFAQEAQHTPRVLLSGTGAASQLQWQGRLVRTQGVVDETTRTLTAIVEVPDPYGVLGNEQHRNNPLRIGSYVRARIDGRPIPGLIRLSQAAIHPGNKVWLVNSEQRLEQRKIEVLMRSAQDAYVTSGLNDGDWVSTTSLSSFSTGAKVRIASLNGEQPEPRLQLESAASAGPAAPAEAETL